MEQYDQKNNIEITGILDNIQGKHLELSVIVVNKAANIQISHNNIENCNHIRKHKGNNSKRTIVSLMNQKYCKQILYNRKKFINFDGSRIFVPNAKIFTNKNLTNSNQQLAFNCRKLKRAKLISKAYSSNGNIHMVQIHSNKPIKVFHQRTRYELFPNFNFEGGGEAPNIVSESN